MLPGMEHVPSGEWKQMKTCQGHLNGPEEGHLDFFTSVTIGG